jgi:hypothetical protein
MHGDTLQLINMFDFLINTYETRITPEDEKDGPMEPGHRKRGRPANHRIRYKDTHPCATTQIRVLRTADHNWLPNIIGGWLPREDEADDHNFYCASILMLFKPWCVLSMDLKAVDQSWESALDEFIGETTDRIRYIVKNTQYLHECERSSDQKKNVGAINIYEP